MHLIFDLETNGLLNDLTTIHCIGIHDLDTDETYVFNDTGAAQPISKGVQMLEDADAIVGHNVIGFDCPALQGIYPWFTPPSTVADTLVLSRVIHSDLLRVDHTRKVPLMPLQLYGRHSLEAWGHRLHEYKGEFGKTTDWQEWSEEMENYMLQDVKVTTRLWRYFLPYLTGSN